MNTHAHNRGRVVRFGLMALLMAVLFTGVSTFQTQTTSANHPVLVEGNCDSPVPGTTTVAAGTCGDYDGDTRIGTAEDTDGADRIFGTLRAAIGPGTGAAAGTGANQNGRVTIVASGRFAEQLVIGMMVPGIPDQGTANPGNLTIEAAPGVEANIDAILQGDPAGGNVTRTTQVGIFINLPDATRVATLRNLVIRNWQEGVRSAANGRVLIDNCRFEGNLDYGIRTQAATRMVVINTVVNGTGYRTGLGSSTPTMNTGIGIQAEGASTITIADSTVSHSVSTGIANATGGPEFIRTYNVKTFFNNPNFTGSIRFGTNDPIAQ